MERPPSVEDVVYGMLKKFAQDHPTIKAVYKGYYPEDTESTDRNRTYFFLTGDKQFDPLLEREIARLNQKIVLQTPHRCSVRQWPIPPQEAKDYCFLEEIIWQRSP